MSDTINITQQFDTLNIDASVQHACTTFHSSSAVIQQALSLPTFWTPTSQQNTLPLAQTQEPLISWTVPEIATSDATQGN